jgi:hypothetical protein
MGGTLELFSDCGTFVVKIINVFGGHTDRVAILVDWLELALVLVLYEFRNYRH